MLKSLSEVREMGRIVERVFMVTDTGGENWGSGVIFINCLVVRFTHIHRLV